MAKQKPKRAPLATANCIECGAPLQASITVYLSDVAVRQDGTVSTFRIDNREGLSDDFEAAISELVESAEGDELRIYCENDHVHGEEGEGDKS